MKDARMKKISLAGERDETANPHMIPVSPASLDDTCGLCLSCHDTTAPGANNPVAPPRSVYGKSSFCHSRTLPLKCIIDCTASSVTRNELCRKLWSNKTLMLLKMMTTNPWQRALAVLLILHLSLATLMAAAPSGLSKQRSRAQIGEAFQEKPPTKPAPGRPAKIEFVELGRSVQGRAINATIIGSGAKRVMVLGGVHGDEIAGALLAKALIATLQLESVPDNLTLIIVSEVNPDGVATRKRVNARGVDINRNFPAKSWQPDYKDKLRYPGSQPGTEPETQAVIKLLERYPPALLITFHAALGCVNWDGPGEEVAGILARANGYPLCAYLGYDTPGSLGQYAGADRKIPSVTIELRDAEDSGLARANMPALRAVLAHMSTPAETTEKRASPLMPCWKP
jgi:murein peptide amidase A